MPRIITEELNTKLRREYRLRFFSLLFFIFSLVIVVNLLLASSSYFLLSLYEKAYTSKMVQTETADIKKTNELFNTKINQVHALSLKIPTQVVQADMNISNMLFAYSNPGIDIQSIEILPEGEVVTVTLRGTALTRESLLQFEETIQRDSSFQNFEVPIEALTKQRDISFNVTFIYVKN